MRLGGHQSRLAALTRELATRWEETRGAWTDAKREQFEKEFLVPLFGAVDRAQTALEQLDELATKVRKECE